MGKFTGRPMLEEPRRGTRPIPGSTATRFTRHRGG
jgi:hypothetical protein